MYMPPMISVKMNMSGGKSKRTRVQDYTIPQLEIILGNINIVKEAIDCLPAHKDIAKAIEALVNLKSRLGIING